MCNNGQDINVGDSIVIKDYDTNFPEVLHPILSDRTYKVLALGVNTAKDTTFQIIDDCGDVQWIWYKFVKKAED